MKRSELKQLIRETIEELKKGDVDTHMGAAGKYQSGEFADSEVNREKVFKHWAAANNALIKDKNNFVYMSRNNENQVGTDQLPFKIGKIGSIERAGSNGFVGKMYTSGGPGDNPAVIEYRFENENNNIWTLSTTGTEAGMEGPVSFYTEKDAGNFIKSFKNIFATMVKRSSNVDNDSKLDKLVGYKDEYAQKIIQDVAKLRTRQIKNIGVRKVNYDDVEIKYMNLARDAAASGQAQPNRT